MIEFRGLLWIGITLFLVQCGPGQQARLTFSGAPDAREISRLEAANGNISPEQKQRLKEHQARELKEKLGFKILTKSHDAPFAGLGFAKDKPTGYAVWRDGKASIYPDSKTEVELEQIGDQITRTKLAGRDLNKVLGLTVTGTLMSWNTDNLSQQVVLRPQDTTFSQMRVYDAEPLKGSNLVAMAVQDGGIELWNTVSGSLTRRGNLEPLRPRRIARGSTPSRIIIGTDQGEVMRWRSGNKATSLYSHKGPVLDIVWNDTLGQVISTAKDGTVIVYDLAKKGIVWRVPMKMPAYRLVLDPSGKCLVIIAAVGTSYVIDLQNGSVFALGRTQGKILSDIKFLERVPNYFVARYGAERLAVWRVDRKQSPKRLRPKFGKGILDFVYSKAHNVIIAVTADGRVEYFDAPSHTYLTTALTAFDGISRVAIDSAGNRLLVGLPNGQVVGFNIDPGQKTALRIGAEDTQ